MLSIDLLALRYALSELINKKEISPELRDLIESTSDYLSLTSREMKALEKENLRLRKELFQLDDIE